MHQQDGLKGGSAARSRRRQPARDKLAADDASAGALEHATRQSVRKGMISMLVAAALLLVFNSAGLRTWAHGLPGNAAADMVVAAVDSWHSAMRHASLAAAMATVRDAVAEFRDQGWPGTDMHSAGTSNLTTNQ